MRAKTGSVPSQPSYASAKISDMSSGSALTEDINKLYSSEDSQGNADHLAKAAKVIARKSTIRNTLDVRQELGTSRADRTIGRFTSRLGDSQWEHNVASTPRQTRCEGVGLPMNDFQTDKYAEQFGEFKEYGDYSGRDPHAGLFDSVMGGGNGTATPIGAA